MTRLAPLLALALLATACDEEVTLSITPNALPVAIGLIDNGPDNAAEVRLGYYIVGQTAALDASLSFDPDDTVVEHLTYHWVFERKPADSNLTETDIILPEDDPETDEVNESAFATFVPDAVGTYRLALTVTDEDEEASEEAAIVTVAALPPSELRVELEWEDTQADLDLHLVAPDGSYFVEGEDCFSWFPNPNWGAEALATDNPALAGDVDGEGPGPYREVINLEVPFAGQFKVYVHYYLDHAQALDLSAVSARPTLDVSVFGQSILDGPAEPQNPLLQGEVWYAGIIEWPEMNFAHIDQTLDHETDLDGPAYNF